ncbi:prepilin-type N-terminal cleavage/methylation domain-containing protein [Patescibacteria group bacterium]
MYKNQKGFTLIELLIVIVIIGILAGVLIAIIDPTAQQNRARDAGVQASINKVALATQGFISAYGRAPEADEFIGALDNAEDMGIAGGGAATCTTGVLNCEFEVTGNPLTATGCDATGWQAGVAGAGQCYFHYLSDGASAFIIDARSYGIANTIFEYSSTDGEILQCDGDGANTATETRCNNL